MAHPRRLHSLLLLPFLLLACERAVEPSEPAEAPPPVSFPDGWVGTWRGEIEISGAHAQRLPMELVVGAEEPPGRFAWTIVYGDQPPRQYALVVDDRERGRYVLDEGNSILMPARFLGGELICVFAVMGNRLATTYRVEGDDLHMEIIVSSRVAMTTTGGQGRIPTVDVFDVSSRHRARLTLVE